MSAASTAPPATLVPEPFRDQWAEMWAAHGRGDLPTAVALASQMEVLLEDLHGPRHPYTITMLTARAWLTLCRRTDWPATVELLIKTALRRQAARAQPEADTLRAARNAHACWHVVAKRDTAAAQSLAGPLADMLTALGLNELRANVQGLVQAQASRTVS
ncbi:hypothetical protein [Streptomyces sp. A1136]|uniref:hypothetical protein n=1 Tax=Streptomyces sp. A1136 TaxID=2563102 RepID=UPI00109E5DAE|nr:hypothetical protein [Streptomyces sp. A1136]THA53146.1 hypothetical protein E6R62_18790 [Streptomyces sp. A1136]